VQYVQLLQQNRNYRNLWSANVVSLIGDWFNLVAAATLIANLTESGAAVSLLFLVRFVPLFLFSPIGGVMADRFSRKRLMILSDLVRALTVFGFLLVRSPGDLWILYTLTVVQFAFSALFTPARSATIPNIVVPGQLVTANALDSLTWSSMLAIGALIGGVVASLFGYQVAFTVDALTFLLSAFFVTRLVVPPEIDRRRPTDPSRAQRPLADFIDGFRYLRREPFIFGIALVKGGGSLCWGAVNVLEVYYAESVFPLGESGATTLGLIYLTVGIGTGFGPLLMRRWFGDNMLHMRWGILLGYMLLTVGLAGLALAPTLPFFLGATLVRTLGSGTIWVFSAVLLQMILPNDVRGRVFGFEFAFLTLTNSLSVAWAGFAQDSLQLPVEQVTMSMALLSVVVGCAWLAFHLRHLRTSYAMPEGPAEL